MKHAVLPPLGQQLEKRLHPKGKRQQRKQNEVDIEIYFQNSINEELDQANWQQLLKILGL